ncbi:hypothetical protein [Archangium sp.]|jgi:hypothetical protein|uniref:hypothetical protein n=1 Tax=Archangium sp. TaxID=1872627 RepID=UPI002ED8CAA1
MRVLLPFTEGLGSRTVRLVLWAEHRPGEAEARGRVESARVEHPEVTTPELSWYRAMHEASLVRWREGVQEGTAWLAQKSVEELALWYVGGILARGAGFFATQGLALVSKALRRGPEAAAGWLRTTLKRLPSRDRNDFEQLWRKVQLEGEKALTPGERTRLRGLMERIEQLVQQPLGKEEKNPIRDVARDYFKKLHPEFEALLDADARRFPVHHRRPLEHAHLFPVEDINAADNLVLVRDMVHMRINSLWTRVRNSGQRLTAQEVDDVTRIIDRHFAGHWYNRIDVPNNEAELLAAAESAALKELKRLLPGLE